MTPESAADLESDPRFPSGKWAGFRTQTLPTKDRPKMELLLTFRKGEMTGEGRDRIGKFLVRGSYKTDDGRCHWTKKYVGKHDVFYQGFNEGKGIWGTWEIGVNHGGFHIWPEGQGVSEMPALAAELDLPVTVGEPVTVG
jgi:hypothetical protein